MLPPHVVLYSGIIFSINVLYLRRVFRGGCVREQRLQLTPAAGNRSGPCAGEDISADRADVKLYPIHFPHVRAVGIQLPLEQFEDVRPQHIRQFFP